MTNSTIWTRLVRYIGQDGETRLGQPVDASIDVGLAVAAGQDVEVYIIDGDLYTGLVSSRKDVIKKILSPVTREQVGIIRCLGLNFLGG